MFERLNLFSTKVMEFVFSEKYCTALHCTAARPSVDQPQGGEGGTLGSVDPWQPPPPPLKVDILILHW